MREDGETPSPPENPPIMRPSSHWDFNWDFKGGFECYIIIYSYCRLEIVPFFNHVKLAWVLSATGIKVIVFGETFVAPKRESSAMKCMLKGVS